MKPPPAPQTIPPEHKTPANEKSLAECSQVHEGRMAAADSRRMANDSAHLERVGAKSDYDGYSDPDEDR